MRGGEHEDKRKPWDGNSKRLHCLDPPIGHQILDRPLPHIQIVKTQTHAIYPYKPVPKTKPPDPDKVVTLYPHLTRFLSKPYENGYTWANAA